MRERLHMVVSGHVQGVSFRYYTQQRAQALGLDGWVRNLPDGSVEIVAEGDTARLVELAQWARKGPPSARVMDVRTEFLPAANDVHGFRIAY
ncbi:MAG: acylphosphatase [Chthonomonadales bacterium]